MDFLLRYRGELPARKQCTEEKNAIRSKLHLQLCHMCQAQPLVGGVFDPEIGTAKLVAGSRSSVYRASQEERLEAYSMLGFLIPLVGPPIIDGLMKRVFETAPHDDSADIQKQIETLKTAQRHQVHELSKLIRILASRTPIALWTRITCAGISVV